MGVCLYMWHGRARLPPCLLTSLSRAEVTDTLIIQFNSGWQLHLALQLWLYQSSAPLPHLFLPWEQEQNLTWQQAGNASPIPRGLWGPCWGFNDLWVLDLSIQSPEQ